MMTSLTIDIGNTQIKYDFWDGNEFLKRLTNPNFEEVINLVKNDKVRGIIISSVSRDPRQMAEKFRENLPEVTTVIFDNKEIERYGELIKYKGKVGADRIAAYLGAKVFLSAGEGALIVDMGTAMTLDIADKNGCYCGGNISAGFKTRLKSLAGATAFLPEVENIHKYISFGHDTVSSLQSGAVNGVMGEIIFAQERAKKEFDIRNTLITGGDSEWFAKLLGKERDCRWDPYLVGRGLNSHLHQFYFPLQR
ncbi:MAG: type III pantothenate kinase [Muribaculaceae bacterium]|nr:type III pantothenate kinase [Muribaculaceae bacterium]